MSLASVRRSLLRYALVPWLAACGGDPGPVGPGDTTRPPDSALPDVVGPDTSPGGNHPPELERVGDRKTPVGKTLSITLTAHDADENPLSYSVFGNLPEDARFDKTAARFEWAPKVAGQVVFLTFVVSDGTDFDRETIRIEVTEGATSNPPRLAEVGDQVVPLGADYELKLVATDPDGDGLTYGHEGTLPLGATLDPRTGLFKWRPDASFVGAPVRVTFTASDGTATDSMAVRFIVDDGSAGVPKPPVFTSISSQTARVGEALTLTLAAVDPNGDAVSFGTQGALPEGATLNGSTFRYVAAAGDLGRTFEVAFTATDGLFVAVMKVKFSVTSGTSVTCTPDAYEPNEDLASASAIGPGTVSANLCDTPEVFDLDLYAVEIAAGQELTATLRFDGTRGDADLGLYDANGDLLVVSEGVGSREQLVWPTTTAMTAYLAIYGYGLEPLALDYTLDIGLATATACVDDPFEDNDSPAQAKVLSDSAQRQTLQICPSDADLWLIDVACGQRVEIYMDIQGPADLDLFLFDNAGGLGEPVASAISEDDFEIIDYQPVARPGRWLLEVSGYPFASARAPYEVALDVSGGCQDDAFANPTRATAHTLPSSGIERDLIVCCGDDWFALPLVAGAEALVDLDVSGGAAGLVALAPDGVTQLSSRAPSPAGGIIMFTAPTSGTYFLKVSGEVGTRYGLEWDVTVGAGGCTFMSCPYGEVCDTGSGLCQSDLCLSDTTCPAGYTCRETWCVNACTSDAQCRSGYACKVLEGGRFCGVKGTTQTGGACADHGSCDKDYACLFPGRGGYCAELGCGSCDPGTQCANVNGQSFCAKSCNTGADCRASGGYFCSAEKTCLPQNP